MSLLFYTANKSFAIVPQEEIGRRQSFPVGTPAYGMALSIVMEGKNVEDKLRFFTQWGKKIQVGNLTVESTPTNSFNITVSNGNNESKIFSTYPSLYMNIIESIVNKNAKNILDILHKMQSETINLSKIKEYFPMVNVSRQTAGKSSSLVVKGHFGMWSLNVETLSCNFNGKHICIVCNSTYKDSEFSEKEQLIMSKLIAIANDELFYRQDSVIRHQVDSIIREK